MAQGLDLRLMDVKVQAAMKDHLSATLNKHLSTYLDKSMLGALNKVAYVSLQKRLEETPSIDSTLRYEDAAKHLVGTLVDTLSNVKADSAALSGVIAWKADFAASGAKLYRTLRAQYMSKHDNLPEAKMNLGATYTMYECIRKDIGVSVRRGDVADGKHGRTVGSSVSAIVEAMKDGRIVNAVSRMLEGV